MNLVIPLVILLGVLLLFFVFILITFLKDFLPLFFWGAIYVPTKKERINKIIRFAEIRPGEKAVDLGSGDGRLVIALAKAGAESYGYEVNPVLVYKSKKNIQDAGLEEKAFISLGSFWQADLSEFDVVVVYGMKHVMSRLGKKLKKELKKDARVISNTFELPGWSQVKKEDNIYLYRNRFN